MSSIHLIRDRKRNRVFLYRFSRWLFGVAKGMISQSKTYGLAAQKVWFCELIPHIQQTHCHSVVYKHSKALATHKFLQTQPNGAAPFTDSQIGERNVLPCKPAASHTAHTATGTIFGIALHSVPFPRETERTATSSPKTTCP